METTTIKTGRKKAAGVTVPFQKGHKEVPSDNCDCEEQVQLPSTDLNGKLGKRTFTVNLQCKLYSVLHLLYDSLLTM